MGDPNRRGLFWRTISEKVMAKLTSQQKARAKSMSKRKGVKYPNAWSNLTVARGKKKTRKK